MSNKQSMYVQSQYLLFFYHIWLVMMWSDVEGLCRGIWPGDEHELNLYSLNVVITWQHQ